MTLEEIVARFEGAKRTANGYDVLCPTHADKRPSLGIAIGENGGLVIHCLAGCQTADILAAVGLTLRDLAPASMNGQHPDPEAVYRYTDEQGNPLFEVVRTTDKRFWQRLPGATKGGIGKVRRVLFGLPDLLKAPEGATVYLCEGEKDVLNLRRLGLAATTNVMGAGKWQQPYTDWLSDNLADRRFVILSDNDAPGIQHAEAVYQSLTHAGLSALALLLPNLPEKGDVSDWIKDGGTAETLADLVERAAESDEAEDLSDLSRLSRTPRVSKNWPAPLAKEALHGVIGDLVRAVEPESEADEAALLFNTMSGVANLIGSGPHGHVGATRHALKLNAIIVGETGQARKGTGWDPIEATLRRVDPTWADERIMTNLSSGEGLIWAVRDPITKTVIEKDKKTGRPTGETFTDIEDVGIEDKRLYVIVSEFAGPLKVGSRDGNVLFDVIRQAWDGDRLQTPTKHNAARAKGVHVSINGHITPADLKRYMSETELLNGSANRFVWILSKRSKYLPEGGELPNLNDIVQRLKKAIDRAKEITDVVRRDTGARHVWAAVYKPLTTPPPGLFGAVTSRAAPYVLRFSILFAVLDGETEVRVPHLLAALACWDYAEASARIIFGDRTGNPYADRILAELRKSKTGGLYRNDIGEMFSGHKKDTDQIALALEQLEEYGLAERSRRQTAPKGRPAEFWTAINKSEEGVTGRFLALGKAAAAEIGELSRCEISEISRISPAEAVDL